MKEMYPHRTVNRREEPVAAGCVDVWRGNEIGQISDAPRSNTPTSFSLFRKADFVISRAEITSAATEAL